MLIALLKVPPPTFKLPVITCVLDRFKPSLVLPTTSNLVTGLLVPIPTFPVVWNVIKSVPLYNLKSVLEAGAYNSQSVFDTPPVLCICIPV